MAYEWDTTGEELTYAALDALDSATQVVLSVWVKPTGSGLYGAPFLSQVSSDTNSGILVGCGYNDYDHTRPLLQARNATVAKGRYNATGVYSASAFQHVLLVYNGGGADNAAKGRMYVDGSELTTNWNEISTLPTSLGTSSDGSIHVGNNAAGWVSVGFRGHIAELAIWVGTQLDATAISNLAGGACPRNSELADFSSYLEFYAALRTDAVAWTPAGNVNPTANTASTSTHPTVDEYVDPIGTGGPFPARYYAEEYWARRYFPGSYNDGTVQGEWRPKIIIL